MATEKGYLETLLDKRALHGTDAEVKEGDNVINREFDMQGVVTQTQSGDNTFMILEINSRSAALVGINGHIVNPWQVVL